MTPSQFSRALAATNLRHGLTMDACRLVLVDGLSRNAAARQLGISPSAVSRAVAKIPRLFCSRCRQPIGR